MGSYERGIGNRRSGIRKSGISKSDESCILKPKSETSNWTPPDNNLSDSPFTVASLSFRRAGNRKAPPFHRTNPHLKVVQFEVSDFGFKMQDSSDFEIPDFLVPDLRFPIPAPGF